MSCPMAEAELSAIVIAFRCFSCDPYCTNSLPLGTPRSVAARRPEPSGAASTRLETCQRTQVPPNEIGHAVRGMSRQDRSRTESGRRRDHCQEGRTEELYSRAIDGKVTVRVAMHCSTITVHTVSGNEILFLFGPGFLFTIWICLLCSPWRNIDVAKVQEQHFSTTTTRLGSRF